MVMPNIQVHAGDRASLANLLPNNDAVGVELGVASGDFSKRMVESGKFEMFYGVDLYGDHHDTSEYVQALKYVGLGANYRLLRMRFNEALELFADESVDFVYVDGYAHTGEDAGRTIFEWLDKVKVGGLLCGHDYDPEWPRVVAAVNDLAERTGFTLLVTTSTQNPGPQDRHPSWAVLKTAATSTNVPPDLPERLRRLPGRSAGGHHPSLAQPLRSRLKLATQLVLGPRVTSIAQRWRRRTRDK